MIQLSEIMAGKNYPESGTLLYGNILQQLKDGQPIEIDLEGVLSLPSMFLNASFGRIAKECGIDTLRHKVTFHHITKAQAERLQDYFKSIS